MSAKGSKIFLKHRITGTEKANKSLSLSIVLDAGSRLWLDDNSSYRLRLIACGGKPPLCSLLRNLDINIISYVILYNAGNPKKFPRNETIEIFT